MLNHYRIWCNTESIWVFVWAAEEPSVCPNNNTHTINSDKTTIVEQKLDEEPRDRSGKMRVQQTSRPLNTRTYWTGVGDDPSIPNDMGNGNRIVIDHKIGDDSPLIIYVDFNVMQNITWIHDGYVTWKNCHFDTIDFKMVPRVTQVEEGVNTNYNLYNGYLIIPAAGDGTISVLSDITQSDGGLVQMVPNDLGEMSSAFWNADWNSSTYLFENISPAPYGNGNFNMFAVEVPFVTFVNSLPLLEHGMIELVSSDTDQLGHGIRLKLIATTYIDENNLDHDWQSAFLLTLFREKS